MAPSGDKDQDLGDVYELLGIEEDAGEKEVLTAYRKGSLKCHPDRNPDDPEAAQKFDRLARAKEILLDPVKRGVVDQQRKAKRELELRYAKEDSKRRKMRQNLEGREEAAARSYVDPTADGDSVLERRKKNVQADFAARLRQREADIANRQADVAASAAQVRRSVEEAKVRLTWLGKPAPGAEAIRAAFASFEVCSMEIGDTQALLQFPSREQALRAVLEFRERRHRMPFRAVLADAAKPRSEVGQPQKGSPEETPDAGQRQPPASPPPAAATNFSRWEADMLAGLAGFAAAQKGARAAAATFQRPTPAQEASAAATA